jgi:hypothetical protein
MSRDRNDRRVERPLESQSGTRCSRFGALAGRGIVFDARGRHMSRMTRGTR